MPLRQNNSVLGGCIPHIFPVSLWGVRQVTSSIRVFRNLSFTHSFIHLFIYLFPSLQNKLIISQMLQKSTVTIYHKCNVKVSFIPNEGHKKQDWGRKKKRDLTSAWECRKHSSFHSHSKLKGCFFQAVLVCWGMNWLNCSISDQHTHFGD